MAGDSEHAEGAAVDEDGQRRIVRESPTRLQSNRLDLCVSEDPVANAVGLWVHKNSHKPAARFRKWPCVINVRLRWLPRGGLWFDMRMKCGWFGFLGSVLIGLIVGGSVRADEQTPKGTEAAAASAGDGSVVHGLFAPQRATVDPALAQLEALWTELSERPLAKTAGKLGLERARLELSRLRELIGRRAGAGAIARRKQLVWAALSLSDREMARAELAAALRTALSHREQAELELRAAKHERERRERQRPEQRPVTEPAK